MFNLCCQNERMKFYHGDCVEVMKSLDSSIIDLTVTSPPYDNLRDYKGFNFNFEDTAEQLYRVTKSGGVLVWIVGDAVIKKSETGTSFRQVLSFMDHGFLLHDTMIFHKQTFHMPDPTRYWQVFEYMFIFVKDKIGTFTPICDRKNICANVTRKNEIREADGNFRLRDKCYTIAEYGKRSNIWSYPVGGIKSTKDKEAIAHPAIFPEKLAIDHILSWSIPGSMIFDPFAGSGTTVKMACLLNRKAIGIEISEEYCTIAKKRIIQAINK